VRAGLAATLAAFFTSRFGVAGTVVGTVLTAMIITAGSALFGVYLERAAAKARNVRGRSGVTTQKQRKSPVLSGALQRVPGRGQTVARSWPGGREGARGKAGCCQHCCVDPPAQSGILHYWATTRIPDGETHSPTSPSSLHTPPGFLGGGRHIP
jgi:hypothetical protein